jgi:hypothetical protein
MKESTWGAIFLIKIKGSDLIFISKVALQKFAIKSTKIVNLITGYFCTNQSQEVKQHVSP